MMSKGEIMKGVDSDELVRILTQEKKTRDNAKKMSCCVGIFTQWLISGGYFFIEYCYSVNKSENLKQ